MGSETTSVRAYVLTALVLLTLTGLNIGLAFVPLGPWNTPIALGIAATKALLIGAMFMHLRSSPSMVRLTALVGLAWLAILMSGTLDDVLTRGWLAVPGKSARRPAQARRVSPSGLPGTAGDPGDRAGRRAPGVLLLGGAVDRLGLVAHPDQGGQPTRQPLLA